MEITFHHLTVCMDCTSLVGLVQQLSNFHAANIGLILKTSPVLHATLIKQINQPVLLTNH